MGQNPEVAAGNRSDLELFKTDVWERIGPCFSPSALAVTSCQEKQRNTSKNRPGETQERHHSDVFVRRVAALAGGKKISETEGKK